MSAMQDFIDGQTQRTRDARRDYAERTDSADLLKYLSGQSFTSPVRRAAAWVQCDMLNPEAGAELLHELWQMYRALQSGKRGFYWTGVHTIYELRKNLSAVVHLCREQRARVDGQASMNAFINSLAAE